MRYTRVYKMRFPITGRNYIIIGVPHELVEQQAHTKGLTIDEFIQQYRIVWEYNDSGAIQVTFQPSFNRNT